MTSTTTTAPAPSAPAAESPRMVAFSVSFYIVTSIVMVMVNKWVLNAAALPLTFLWGQLVVAVALLQVTHLTGVFTVPPITKDSGRKLWRLIAINVVGLSVNTFCLQYVDASFYQVARGLVLPFTVVFSHAFLAQKSSQQVVLTCAVVCAGYFTGTLFESVTVSTVGVLFGVVSSLTTAGHAIVIKKSLEAVQNKTMDLVWYNNVWSAIVLAPFVLVSGELSTLVSAMSASDKTGLLSADDINVSQLFYGTLIAGFFGFLINVAGFLQIKVTSPITHMISSAVRGVLQTAVAVAVFGDLLTAPRVLGIALILAGSSAYTVVRHREMTQPAPSYSPMSQKV